MNDVPLQRRGGSIQIEEHAAHPVRLELIYSSLGSIGSVPQQARGPLELWVEEHTVALNDLDGHSRDVVVRLVAQRHDPRGRRNLHSGDSARGDVEHQTLRAMPGSNINIEVLQLVDPWVD